MRNRGGAERPCGGDRAGEGGPRAEVLEAEAEPGGAVRTLPLRLPGFQHDFGAAVMPMAAGSPFFRTLPLYVEWVHGEAPLADPLDDGSAVRLERSHTMWRETGRGWPCVARLDGTAGEASGGLYRGDIGANAADAAASAEAVRILESSVCKRRRCRRRRGSKACEPARCLQGWQGTRP